MKNYISAANSKTSRFQLTRKKQCWSAMSYSRSSSIKKLAVMRQLSATTEQLATDNATVDVVTSCAESTVLICFALALFNNQLCMFFVNSHFAPLSDKLATPLLSTTTTTSVLVLLFHEFRLTFLIAL